MSYRRLRLQVFFLKFALRGGTDFNVSKCNVLICFNITRNEKSEKSGEISVQKRYQ